MFNDYAFEPLEDFTLVSRFWPFFTLVSLAAYCLSGGQKLSRKWLWATKCRVSTFYPLSTGLSQKWQSESQLQCYCSYYVGLEKV
jgi:hypothetical protein